MSVVIVDGNTDCTDGGSQAPTLGSLIRAASTAAVRATVNNDSVSASKALGLSFRS